MTFSLTNKFLLSIAILFMISCNQDDPFEIDYSGAPDPFVITGIEPVTTETGLIYYEVEKIDGPFVINRRDQVQIYYTGRNTNGNIFDSSYRNGSTTPSFFGDLGSLIQGFREGLIGMKEGEKRVLIIPPSLGYENARQGTSGYNLRNDTLRFDIEVDKIIN